MQPRTQLQMYTSPQRHGRHRCIRHTRAIGPNGAGIPEIKSLPDNAAMAMPLVDETGRLPDGYKFRQTGPDTWTLVHSPVHDILVYYHLIFYPPYLVIFMSFYIGDFNISGNQYLHPYYYRRLHKTARSPTNTRRQTREASSEAPTCGCGCGPIPPGSDAQPRRPLACTSLGPQLVSEAEAPFFWCSRTGREIDCDD